MIDIIEISSQGLQIFDTQVPRASNILAVQLGALEYSPTLGIDLNYFLDNSIEFQNDSFQAYIVQVLANSGINVASLDVVIRNLFSEYNINLAPEQIFTGLIAR